MYLASYRQEGQKCYAVRKSYLDQGGVYYYRQVFDLGPRPENHILNPVENVYCFSEALERAVQAEYGSDPTTLLEKLLWDFLPLEQKQTIRTYTRKNRRKLTPLSDAEREEIRTSVHLFDRRRLYYIRYGAVDQSRIYRVNEKLYRPLLQKSRDEKEFYFQKLEQSLAPAEYKKYIFAIFDIQRSFTENFSPFMPEALDQEKMDNVFLTELCRLNGDEFFWKDGKDNSSLREHLHGYVIRFFDSVFEARFFQHDYYQAFRAGHRNVRPPGSKPSVKAEEIGTIFGKSIGELRGMKRAELARLFRAKAKEYHPDSGGEAEKFIQLRQAYEILRKG
ncbi:MAG: J domain-containing protein [Desulfopila sp.]|jgi:hypothetical protein|nr:J domain-containing protein [Desulfopila sp.]